MYIPKHNLATDRSEIIAFMKRYNFATIITAKDSIPIATHLPFIIKEESNKVILASHFAKANPQWKDIFNIPVLVIFTEPHAYISTKHYDAFEAVPTWNYIAVHAYGQGQLIEGQDSLFALLESMMDVFEPAYKKQWADLSMDFKLKMLNGIVAFNIIVTDLQGKMKLSQNRTEIEQERIIMTLSASSRGNENVVAEYMKKNKK